MRYSSVYVCLIDCNARAVPQDHNVKCLARMRDERRAMRLAAVKALDIREQRRTPLKKLQTYLLLSWNARE
jgi:hypothetical protein